MLRDVLGVSVSVHWVGEIPDGDRWDSPPKIRFAPDSPPEEERFEPSVPLRLGAGLQAKTLRAEGEERVWGIRPGLRSGE